MEPRDTHVWVITFFDSGVLRSGRCAFVSPVIGGDSRCDDLVRCAMG